MSILTKGDNILFVNSATSLALLFTLLNSTTRVNENSTAALGDGMLLGGYMRADLADVTGRITAERPRVAVKHKLTVDSAQAGQFKLAAGFTPGKVIRFVIDSWLIHDQGVKYHNRKPGLGKEYSLRHFFAIKLRPGDTEATVLERLSKAVNYNAQVEYGELDYTVSYAGGVLTVESKHPDIELTLTAWDKVDEPSTQCTLEPVVAAQAYEGVGQYDNLHTYRLQTTARNEAYAINQYESPIEGAQYTCLTFQTRTQRDDLVLAGVADGGPLASINQFTLFIRDGLESFLSDILAFISRAPGTVKTFTKSDGQPITQAAFLLDHP